MSSSSPKRRESDAIVLGHGWLASLAASELKRAGVSVRLAFPASPVPSPALPAYLGNGECRAKAGAVYGETLSESLWEFSSENLSVAREIAGSLGRPAEARWIARTSGELDWLERSRRKGDVMERESRDGGSLRTPALQIDYEKLDRHIVGDLATGACVERWSEISSIAAGGSRDGVTVRARHAGSEFEWRATVVVVTETPLATEWLPWLADKWIFVTLSSFLCPARRALPSAVCLWNLGADFAVAEGGSHWLGSFRSLHSDSAIGVLGRAENKARDAVTRFFSRDGWIDVRAPTTDRWGVAGLACDGVPVVGSVPSLPSVYVLGGFAGRPQNFAFAACRKLARGLAGKAGFEGLAPFSARRFV